MKVQLLLLLALAGPLCSFTRASPTTVASYSSSAPEETKTTVITGPSPTDPPVAPQDATLSTAEPVATTEADIDVPTTESNQIPETTTVEVNEAPTVHTLAFAETSSPPPETTAAPAFETTASEETSSPLKDETEAPIDPTMSADEATGTDGGNADLTVETEEGMSTGQIVGIVIGAIVAVVIVIAVVIAVLRRMGKYSSTKSRKPAKKDSVVVSPLKKKSTKQQERGKFWKS
ncbi:podoplanin isoform X1 [Poecilia formosa]|uniref:podoplanin isoform X1 n=1 Tax=Poecilia formosa TaxID=48698 RepID=UPI0004444440|nr:PREDICTED: proline-rich receptor-like protein kinase PERK1 isoform X1 [Poecilia formosa]